ncbi:MAG: hypothetical protein CL917_10895 [Deltaproteobacteria bacterium]|nr:hypothetical protein [Deltaproteobacteria bacterium]
MGIPRGLFLDFPLGHTAGKKGDEEMQRKILMQALDAFVDIKTAGEIQRLPYRWSADESWRENPMNGGSQSKSKSSGDFRTPRSETPQYQEPEDEKAFLEQHTTGACGTCIGAE